MNKLCMRLVVMVAGFLGWLPLGFASVIQPEHQPIPWLIEAADYTGEVKGQIVRMSARYTVRVIQNGWIEIPISIEGATITAIDVNPKSADTHIAARGKSYVLVTSRKGTYKVHVKFSSSLSEDSQYEGLRLGIPQATFSTLSVFVPRKDVELRSQDQLYVEHEPDGPRGGVRLTARLGASDQIDLRWRTKPSAPIKIEPVLYGEVCSFITIEEQMAHITSIIDYRAAQGETKQLMIQLPGGVNLINVRGAGIDDWHVSDAQTNKELLVTLNFTLKDTTYRLILEAEQTIDGKSADYTVPEIQLSGLKQERGYIALAREGNIEISTGDLEGINRVDVKELPQALRSSSGTPAMLAFKYHQHPYRVALSLTRHQDHAVLAAIAERGELVTVLSAQGELLTRATYLIQANKKQYLTVVLPEDATLWGCIVDGKSIKPVEGKERELLLTLDTMSDSAEAVSVELVYFERMSKLTGMGQLKLQGPVLDVPTTIANWYVYAPSEIKFLRMSGNLTRGAASFEFLDEPFENIALTSSVFAGEKKSDWKVARKGPDFQRIIARGEAGNVAKPGFESGDLSMGSYREVRVRNSELPYPSAAPLKSDEDKLKDDIAAFAGRFKETGIFPLKIRLPKSGTVYRFNRLMTAQDALRLEATFVHVHLPFMPFAAFGLLVIPSGMVIAARFAHR